MADLIDREALKDNLVKLSDVGARMGQQQFCIGVKNALTELNAALSVDAVPVIRCKDCIHFLQYTKNAGDCNIWENEMKICDFCSYAEPVEKSVESVDK